ncbi:hypothetical protein L345_03955, partial [Ophiophagus hannah]
MGDEVPTDQVGLRLGNGFLLLDVVLRREKGFAMRTQGFFRQRCELLDPTLITLKFTSSNGSLPGSVVAMTSRYDHNYQGNLSVRNYQYIGPQGTRAYSCLPQLVTPEESLMCLPQAADDTVNTGEHALPSNDHKRICSSGPIQCKALPAEALPTTIEMHLEKRNLLLLKHSSPLAESFSEAASGVQTCYFRNPNKNKKILPECQQKQQQKLHGTPTSGRFPMDCVLLEKVSNSERKKILAKEQASFQQIFLIVDQSVILQHLSTKYARTQRGTFYAAFIDLKAVQFPREVMTKMAVSSIDCCLLYLIIMLHKNTTMQICCIKDRKLSTIPSTKRAKTLHYAYRSSAVLLSFIMLWQSLQRISLVYLSFGSTGSLPDQRWDDDQSMEINGKRLANPLLGNRLHSPPIPIRVPRQRTGFTEHLHDSQRKCLPLRQIRRGQKQEPSVRCTQLLMN